MNNAFWSGYTVSYKDKHTTVAVIVKEGIRGINIPVTLSFPNAPDNYVPKIVYKDTELTPLDWCVLND